MIGINNENTSSRQKRMNSFVLLSFFCIFAFVIILGSNYDIVGTWIGYACRNGNTKDLDWNNKLTLVFKADGTGKYLEVPPTSHHENVECNFLYEMEDTKRGKAYISAMKTNIYFELIGKNMNIYYGAGFGSNIDYYLTKQ